MALSQVEVNEKYARFRSLHDGLGVYIPREAMEISQELQRVRHGMLQEASVAYMRSIGRDGQFDWGLIFMQGLI